jgi:hypothetical protein
VFKQPPDEAGTQLTLHLQHHSPHRKSLFKSGWHVGNASWLCATTAYNYNASKAAKNPFCWENCSTHVHCPGCLAKFSPQDGLARSLTIYEKLARLNHHLKIFDLAMGDWHKTVLAPECAINV